MALAGTQFAERTGRTLFTQVGAKVFASARLNGELSQENLDGAAQPRPNSAIPVNGEVCTGKAFDQFAHKRIRMNDLDREFVTQMVNVNILQVECHDCIGTRSDGRRRDMPVLRVNRQHGLGIWRHILDKRVRG